MAKNLAAPGITPPHYEREPLVIEGELIVTGSRFAPSGILLGGESLVELLFEAMPVTLYKHADYSELGRVRITIEWLEDDNATGD